MKLKKKTDEEEGREYLFFDIESRQDNGQHITNQLILQVDTGFERCSKQMTALTNSVHGCWMELTKMPLSLPIT